MKRTEGFKIEISVLKNRGPEWFLNTNRLPESSEKVEGFPARERGRERGRELGSGTDELNQRKRAEMWSSGIYDYIVETHARVGETMAQRARAGSVCRCTRVGTCTVCTCERLWACKCLNVCIGRSFRWWRGIFPRLSCVLATIRLQWFLLGH